MKHVPGEGMTDAERQGDTDKSDSNGGGEKPISGFWKSQNQTKEFDRIDLMAKIMAPPPIKFQDLEQFMATSKILTGPPFLFDVRTDYVKVTDDTVIVPITMQIKNSDITFDTKDGVSVGKVEIQGRVSNMTHKTVQTFGAPLQVDTPSELLPAKQKAASVYWFSLALHPGLYKVDMVMKDVNNPDHIGRWTRSLNVPKYDDDTLGHSSLILADEMYRVPSKEIGAGQFVLGDTLVRPRVSMGGPSVPPQFQPGTESELLDADLQSRHRWEEQEERRDDQLSDHESGYEQAGAGQDGAGVGAESERGAVDGREEPAVGGPCAGAVSGEDQSERWHNQAADGRVGEVFRELELTWPLQVEASDARTLDCG